MAGHAQLKFVMTECSKAQIRLTRHKYILQDSVKRGTNLLQILAELSDRNLKESLSKLEIFLRTTGLQVTSCFKKYFKF